jgi:hypothetical protein
MKRKILIKIIPILMIISFVIVIANYSYEFDCKENKACYDRHLESCKKTKLTINDEGSTFSYQILREQDGRCLTKVTLLDMPQEADETSKQLFEGKSMICSLEKGSTFNAEILSSCSGPLKESIYELTIQKMYDILARSLGDILEEL